jgi:hypothetical protein
VDCHLGEVAYSECSPQGLLLDAVGGHSSPTPCVFILSLQPQEHTSEALVLESPHQEHKNKECECVFWLWEPPHSLPMFHLSSQKPGGKRQTLLQTLGPWSLSHRHFPPCGPSLTFLGGSVVGRPECEFWLSCGFFHKTSLRAVMGSGGQWELAEILAPRSLALCGVPCPPEDPRAGCC